MGFKIGAAKIGFLGWSSDTEIRSECPPKRQYLERILNILNYDYQP
jgi:hypothetical protein